MKIEKYRNVFLISVVFSSIFYLKNNVFSDILNCGLFKKCCLGGVYFFEVSTSIGGSYSFFMEKNQFFI